MAHVSDSELLAGYVGEGSQAAFAGVVARHVDLVYGVALRRVRDPGMAEDVTQAVFVILARKAGSVRHREDLAGWLFQTARYAASEAMKRAARRRRHEEEAARMAATEVGPADVAHLDLDGLLGRLSEGERHALLLRYYEGRSLAEVGAALQTSEEAARKRIDRALARLRGYAGVPAESVAGALAAQQIVAPGGLAAGICGQLGGASGVAAGIAQGVIRTMIYKQVATAAMLAVAAMVTVGLGVYVATAAGVPGEGGGAGTGPAATDLSGGLSGPVSTFTAPAEVAGANRFAYFAAQRQGDKGLITNTLVLGTIADGKVAVESRAVEHEKVRTFVPMAGGNGVIYGTLNVGQLAAFDPGKGTFKIYEDEPFKQMAQYGGTVYLFRSDGIVRALDTATGKISPAAAGIAPSSYHPPVVSPDGKRIAYVIDANDLTRGMMPKPVATAPALGNVFGMTFAVHVLDLTAKTASNPLPAFGYEESVINNIAIHYPPLVWADATHVLTIRSDVEPGKDGAAAPPGKMIGGVPTLVDVVTGKVRDIGFLEVNHCALYTHPAAEYPLLVGQSGMTGAGTYIVDTKEGALRTGLMRIGDFDVDVQSVSLYGSPTFSLSGLKARGQGQGFRIQEQHLVTASIAEDGHQLTWYVNAPTEPYAMWYYNSAKGAPQKLTSADSPGIPVWWREP